MTNVEVTVPINTVIEWQGTQYNTGETITITLNTRYRTAVISSLLGDLTGVAVLWILLFLKVFFRCSRAFKKYYQRLSMLILYEFCKPNKSGKQLNGHTKAVMVHMLHISLAGLEQISALILSMTVGCVAVCHYLA